MKKSLACLVVLAASVASADPVFLRSIELGVQLPAEAKGHHVSEVALYGPDGSLLGESSHPYAAGVNRAAGETPAAMLEDGYEISVTLQVPEELIQRYPADAEFRAVIRGV